jgi:hypothetical protein
MFCFSEDFLIRGKIGFIYLFNTNGKSGIVWGFAVAGVCLPLVNSFTLSEI